MKPAIKWGLIGGVLSALPCLNLLNLCCCAWAWLAGLLTAREMAKDRETYGPGDGVKDALLTGGVGVAVYAVLNFPIQLLAGRLNARMMEMWSKMLPADNPFSEGLMRGMASSGHFAGACMNTLIGVVFLFVFVVVGGAIGGVFFKRPKT